MKLLLIFFLLVFTCSEIDAQVVSSSCATSDSVKTLYRNDADRLAMRIIIDSSLTYTDSIEIPQAPSDTILNALIAVYNATALPARDTVISMYNIHTFPLPTLNAILLLGDTNAYWMEQLQIGNFTTGEAFIDTLIAKYGFDNVSYTNLSFGANDMVLFESDSNYNLEPLIDSLSLVSGVIIVDQNGSIGDGSDIHAIINSDHVELTYELAMGDCPSGCLWHRYWKFKVYVDCSVEFVESWGDAFTYFGIENEITNNLSVFPNPTGAIFTISSSTMSTENVFIQLYDYSGTLVLTSENNSQIDLTNYPSGIYLLSIQNQNQIVTLKVVKE